MADSDEEERCIGAQTQPRRPPRDWKRVAIIFGLFGFVMHFRPAEPFMTPYLIDDKGLTEAEVNNQVYPVWTYSYLVFLAVVGPTAEYIGYKLVVIIFALSDLVTRITLVWGETLGAMQFMQVTFGLSTATEVGYFSLLYQLVDEHDYQRITSYTRALVLLGSVLSGILAQVLVSYLYQPLVLLFYITLATSAAGTLSSLFLPGAPAATDSPVIAEGTDSAISDRTDLDRADRAKSSEFDGTAATVNADSTVSTDGADKRVAGDRSRVPLRRALAEYARALRSSFSSADLATWSVWWALAFCGLLAVEGYASSVWYSIDASVTFNGFCDSVGRLAGAAGSVVPTLMAGKTLDAWAEPMLVLGSGAAFGWVLWMALTESIWAAYATYILFEGTMYLLLAVAAAKIAQMVANERYALIFGVNTFAALLMLAVMQVIAGPGALDMDIRARFYMNTAFMGVLCVAAMVPVARRARAACRGEAYEHVEQE